MDNTNINKDVVETPADKKPAESIAATSTTNLDLSDNSQSTKPTSEAPASKADDACAAAAKEGDTLLTIANRHKVSLGLLKFLNGIDDALKRLDKGKRIKLK